MTETSRFLVVSQCSHIHLRLHYLALLPVEITISLAVSGVDMCSASHAFSLPRSARTYIYSSLTTLPKSAYRLPRLLTVDNVDVSVCNRIYDSMTPFSTSTVPLTYTRLFRCPY